MSKYNTLDTTVEERNYIIDYLEDNTSKSDGKTSSPSTTAFQIRGKPVCKQAWLTIHGINPRRFDRINHDFQTGSKLYIHGNSGLKRPTTKTSECIAWLTFLVNAIGDHQPDSHKAICHLVLPNFHYTKKCVKNCIQMIVLVSHSSIASWIKSLITSRFQRFVTFYNNQS